MPLASWYQYRPISSGTSWPGWVVTPAQPDRLQPPGVQCWPGSAPGAQRALTYTFVAAPATPPPPTGLSAPTVSAYLYRPKRARDYTWVVTADPTSVAIFPTTARPEWPNRAQGPIRSAATAYGGVVAPAFSDRLQPPGTQRWPHAAPAATRARDYDIALKKFPLVVTTASPAWPDMARAARQPLAAYQCIVNPAIPDALLPASPLWPDRAPGKVLASSTSYLVALPQPPAYLPTDALPIWPPLASGRPRAAVGAYGGIALPAQADFLQPPGTQRWPDSAPGSRRALDYTVIVSPSSPAILITNRPVWPDFARTSQRSAATAYGGIASPAQADLLNPAGWQVWPAVVQGSRRAFDCTWIVQPALADAILPSGQVEWPHRAGSARRTAFSVYGVSLPQQPFLQVPLTGVPSFPDQAAAARRASVTAYVNPVSRFDPVPVASLGRFRQGDTVALAWEPGILTAPPIAVVTGPPGVVDAQTLSTRNRLTWNFQEFLGANFPPGNYMIQLPGGDHYGFTVVAGGDPAGHAIAMLYTKNVQGHRVLVQTRAGELLLGTDPKLP